MNKYIGLLVCSLAILTGCSKDPTAPPVVNEHPPATTVILMMVRVNDAGKALDTTSCTVRDTSVIKGKPTLEGKLDLMSGSTYHGRFVALDESQTPAKDVTSAIMDEKDAHIFKFAVKENSNPSTVVVITNLDKDSKGLDFGLNFTAITSDIAKPSDGVIHVMLEHHDDGNKAGAQFDTDLDREFPFSVR